MSLFVSWLPKERSDYIRHLIWRLSYPNIGPERAKKSSRQGTRCGFLVLLCLQAAHRIRHSVLHSVREGGANPAFVCPPFLFGTRCIQARGLLGVISQPIFVLTCPAVHSDSMHPVHFPLPGLLSSPTAAA